MAPIGGLLVAYWWPYPYPSTLVALKPILTRVGGPPPTGSTAIWGFYLRNPDPPTRLDLIDVRDLRVGLEDYTEEAILAVNPLSDLGQRVPRLYVLSEASVKGKLLSTCSGGSRWGPRRSRGGWAAICGANIPRLRYQTTRGQYPTGCPLPPRGTIGTNCAT